MDTLIDISQKVAILIDGNNIEKSIKGLFGDYLMDFNKIIPSVLKGRQLCRLLYFREGKTISKKLSDKLQRDYFGKTIACGKSADVPIVIHAIQLADKVDTVILFSGDEDFTYMIEFLNNKGVRTEIVSILGTTSGELIKHADSNMFIDKSLLYPVIIKED